MSTIRTILKSSKDADGNYPVLLMLSDRGKRVYIATGFSAKREQFDDSKEGGRFLQGRGIRPFSVTRKEENGSIGTYTNKEANDALANLELRAANILKSYQEKNVNWSLEQFRSDFVNAPKRSTFYRFAEEVVEKDYRDREQISTANTVKYTLIALKRFDHDIEAKTFQEITSKYLEAFEAFCKKEGAVPGTISIRMRVIKRIFNIAIRDKVISRDLYPFSNGSDDGRYRPPQPKLTKTNQFLPTESLKKLATHKFSRTAFERDKHLFLFSFYCKGINWKDMALLRKSNVHRITTAEGEEIQVLRYCRAKTQGEFELKIDLPIQRELDWFKANTRRYSDYLLPIIAKKIAPDDLGDYLAQRRKRFNANLKKMAIELEFPESQLSLTSYHARHSFAMALLDKGKPVEIISQALGHQSVKTTKHYLAKFSTTRMAEETYIDLLDDDQQQQQDD